MSWVCVGGVGGGVVRRCSAVATHNSKMAAESAHPAHHVASLVAHFVFVYAVAHLVLAVEKPDADTGTWARLPVNPSTVSLLVVLVWLRAW